MTARIALAAVTAIALQGAAFQTPITAADVPNTEITSKPALQKLIDNTGITLQWNWDTRPGALKVAARDGQLALHGEQHAANGGSLDLDGVVMRLDASSFLFKGRIAIHDAEANVDCVRDGEYNFRIIGARKFWRMKEQVVQCAGRPDLTDYVDILFK